VRDARDREVSCPRGVRHVLCQRHDERCTR
jgi:hypothetical protein